MNNIKYFFQFFFIVLLFFIFKLIGYKFSIILSGKILNIIGPLFRSKNICLSNLSIAFPKMSNEDKENIIKKMWNNYGKVFAEYMFISNFRKKIRYSQNILIENQDELNQIKISNQPVIFISGHFNNFELMAMHIEKSGIDLAAIYRPLNNKFLNPIMEKIRKKYICKNQIEKGISGTKKLLRYFKSGKSIALMIDQRVSEGIRCNLFGQKALTTTIPAQFVKKFNAKIIPIHIERIKFDKFKLKVFKPLVFKKEESIDTITLELNKFLEKMICKNPEQWIWTHNRWK
tara:strand:- start:185 stop:1048 length:864 start_codon:yes stop_codon:yes gene_type:complete